MIGLVRQQRLTTLAAAIVLVLTATLNGGCDKPSSTQTAVSPTAPSFPGASISEAVLVGAGDISMCGQPGAEATAKLLDDIPGTVFASGDNAYMKGSVADFQCYDRTWGRHKSRTYASPGNHEYESGARRRISTTSASAPAPPGSGTTRSISVAGTSSR